MQYSFEWDPEKARTNLDKHGVSFEESATVFQDPNALSVFDSEHSRMEDRWVTLGISSRGRIVLVCHTYRDESEAEAVIRIISCRKATKQEERNYGE